MRDQLEVGPGSVEVGDDMTHLLETLLPSHYQLGKKSGVRRSAIAQMVWREGEAREEGGAVADHKAGTGRPACNSGEKRSSDDEDHPEHRRWGHAAHARIEQGGDDGTGNQDPGHVDRLKRASAEYQVTT